MHLLDQQAGVKQQRHPYLPGYMIHSEGQCSWMEKISGLMIRKNAPGRIGFILQEPFLFTGTRAGQYFIRK